MRTRIGLPDLSVLLIRAGHKTLGREGAACACAGLGTLLYLRVAPYGRYWRPLLLSFGT